MASIGIRLYFIVISLFLLGAGFGSQNISDPIREDYPASLKGHIQKLTQAHAKNPDSVDLLIKLASAYLGVGDDLHVETSKQLEAYQAGAYFAKQALELAPKHAECHFLYAANLGHIAQIKGVLVSALLIREIKEHVDESIKLAPNHAPTLHMMGMILDGLPWFLGGDTAGAFTYLERAVSIDPNYAHARLNLGKVYLKQGRTNEAKEQFLLVTKTLSPREVYAWRHRHNPEAHRLLRKLHAQTE